MKPKRKLLTVALAVIMLVATFTASTAFSASAATAPNPQYSMKNTISVKSFTELSRALSATTVDPYATERYVRLDQSIKYEKDSDDCEIKITYPGKITFDLNGYELEVSSNKTQNLFSISGKNATEFTIINTKAATRAAGIIFNSTWNLSSVIWCSNDEATVRILGKSKYNAGKIENPSIEIGMNETLTDVDDGTYSHRTLTMSKFTEFYISGAKISNRSKKPVNLRVDGKGSALVTGGTQFVISNSNTVAGNEANVYVAKTYTGGNIKFGACYIEQKGNVKSLLIENKEGYTVSTFLEYPKSNGIAGTHYSVKVGTDSGVDLAIQSSKTIDIYPKCCSFANAETANPIDGMFGHVRRCAVCKGIVTVESHTFVGAPTLGYAATCTEDGMEDIENCTDCKYYEGGETIPKLGHLFNGDYKIVVEPTCTEPGRKARTCSRSGCNETEGFLEYVDALGHDENRSTTHFCSKCKTFFAPEKIGVDKKSAETGVWYFLTVPETKVYVVSHNINKSKEPTGAIFKVANNKRGESVGAILASPGAVGTSKTEVTLEKGVTYAVVCKTNKGIQDKYTLSIACKEHSVVTDAAVAATCTENGKTEGSHCSTCGKVIVAQSEIKAKGHTEVTDAAVAPTCTEKGKTEGKHCSVCKKVIKAQTEVAALGHKTANSVTKATTKANGKVVSKCTACGKTLSTKTIAKIASVKLSKTAVTYNGKNQTVTVTVKDSSGKTLKLGTDYTVAYKNNKAVGKATVTVKFIGNYSGTSTLSFNILPSKTKSLKAKQTTSSITASWKKVDGASGYRVYLYKGKKLVKSVDTTKLSVTFKKLSKGTQYKIVVKAYRTIDGKKVLSLVSTELLTATKLSAPGSVKVKTAKKQATVSWKKVKGADSYTVYYSTKKNGSFKKMTVTKTSATVKKLSSGKNYYFKVVANDKVGGKTIASDDSKTVKAKIK